MAGNIVASGRLPVCKIQAFSHWLLLFWRGGRVVDCAGLENRRAERLRGFESHLLRHLSAQRILIVEGGMRTQFDRRAAAKTERSEAPQG